MKTSTTDPHPGPLPEGEGESFPVCWQSERLLFVEGRDEFPPLPPGEGRGEGNRALYRSFAFMLGLMVAGLLGCATTAQHGALVRAYDAFNAGAYREALSHAARAETYEADNATAKAEALFLKGRCHEALNERAEAIAAYQLVARDHSSSAFVAKAKARLAELQR